MKKVEIDTVTGLMIAFQVFVGYWVYETIQMFFNYVIVCGICSWYFS